MSIDKGSPAQEESFALETDNTTKPSEALLRNECPATICVIDAMGLMQSRKLLKVLLENAGKGLNFFASNNAGRIPLKGHVKECIDYCEATETQIDSS